MRRNRFFIVTVILSLVGIVRLVSPTGATEVVWNVTTNFGFALTNTNPTPDAGLLPFLKMAAAGSTNAIEFVYRRWQDYAARGLTYRVELTDDLLSGVWTNGGYVEAGSGIIAANFESVTNRIPLGTKTKQMIRLQIGIN